MSSKTEKISHHSHQPPRLSIFYRNLLLLKIVAWLGSLGFISSTGVVWALKLGSTSQSEAQALSDTSADTVTVKPVEREIVTAIRSQIQPSYIRQQPTSDRFNPITSLQPQSTAASANGYRAVPAVVSLPAVKYRFGAISTPIQRLSISDRGTPLTGIKPTIVTPTRSPATAQFPIEEHH